MKGIGSMKAFEMIDEENSISVGTLLYFETALEYIIELRDDLDEWTAPLLFSRFVKDNTYTIPAGISLMWIRERVIPPSRQNINSILATHKLKEYDEMRLLELSHARCSQDGIYIRRLDALPEYVITRAKKNVRDCTVSERGYLICLFADDTIKKIDLNKWPDADTSQKILKNHDLLMSGHVGTGGYSVRFDTSTDLPAAKLYQEGETVPLKIDDFLGFIRNNVIDAAQCCDMLECTRQNISYLVSKDRLTPVKENVKGNLYLKGDILANTW